MKRMFVALLCFLITTGSSFGQVVQRHKIAIFTPLYLDSVFNSSGIQLEKNYIPRYVVPGLEYYQGVQYALDSLNKRGAPLEVFILDSRSKQSLTQQLAKPEMNNVEMIIANTNATETRTLAQEALRKKIPFISTALPNDVGITNNPYFVILNSTLPAHVEGIYEFLQKYHSQDRIVLFRKPGQQEDLIKQHFLEYAKNTSGKPLSIKIVEVGSNFTPEILAAHLDSTRKNICIGGSMDETFAQRLALNLSNTSASYSKTLIGMPTWDKLNFNRFENLEVIYTTPFYYSQGTSLENKLSDAYEEEYNNKPSDLFYRGYESMMRFALLLLDTKKDVASNLTRKGNTIFTQFDIQPVFKDSSVMTLDYFENRHLYFIKVFGRVKNIVN
jgi:hypothetical protein